MKRNIIFTLLLTITTVVFCQNVSTKISGDKNQKANKQTFTLALGTLIETDVDTMTPTVKRWEITPTSLVSRDEPPLQKIELLIESEVALNTCVLRVWSGDRLLSEKALGEIKAGNNSVSVLLREPEKVAETRWVLSDASRELAEKILTWNPPRHWTLYVIKSSHLDIGLHGSMYSQRFMTNGFIDQAQQLVDQTFDWPDASRYRYVIEGLYWWLNYPQDRSEQFANEVVQKYVKPGVLGIGASHSGNHTQVFGTEQLCRSAYYTRQIRDRWRLEADAMLMVDNNGISWPLVSAYADAGIKYLGFFPNSWNPSADIPNTWSSLKLSEAVGWGKEYSRMDYGVTSDSPSRIDVGWNSKLPHLFYWKGPDLKSKVLVWTNPRYNSVAWDFGIKDAELDEATLLMSKHLKLLESHYPYNIWLIPHYGDNEKPNLGFSDFAKKWNTQWRWPELRTVGNLAQPFEEVKKRFGDKIPTLSGTITGGWAQHPVSTPTLLSKKMEADRLLPTAEKLATLARLTDPTFIYPTLAFRRAWDALVCNDEHSYGTSTYKGRTVYDTWMQHRDWIEKALTTARTESDRALKVLANQVTTNSSSVFVFNPTIHPRKETVEIDLPGDCAGMYTVHCPDGSTTVSIKKGTKLCFITSEIPSLGYAVFTLSPGDAADVEQQIVNAPPSVENNFYKLIFSDNGAIASIFDKQLGRELIDKSAPYQCNQFVYSRYFNKSFSSPSKAQFEIQSSMLGKTVIARIDDPVSGASIEQHVYLPTSEKRIDIENRLNHVRDLVANTRHYSFGYYAFPFDVPQPQFRVNLNGCDADPYKDQTGHGTDTYHVARDWSHVGNNQFGIALVQQDNILIEFGKIHEKKNTFGETPASSHIYPYIFNNWLYEQATFTGPSYINLRYRYVIYSHAGSFRDAHVAQFAERIVTPVLATVIPQVQKGNLPVPSYSFLSVNKTNVSLLTLKLSETPGRGVVARFHETEGIAVEAVDFNVGWGKDLRLTRCSVTEQDRDVLNRQTLALAPFGLQTMRLEEEGTVPTAPEVVVGKRSDKSVTLHWSPVQGARQYNLYRGNYEGFVPDSYHLLATICGTRFTDDWLKAGTAYYYRVAAIDAETRQGALSERVQGTTLDNGNSPPAKVGTVYTGLISSPKAWRGDSSGILYLQWGQNHETDLSHYELFRSESPDFKLNKNTFLTKVAPGSYLVVPFEDKGLEQNTAYYYHVRAVDLDGHKGQPSEVFMGITLEP